MREQYHYKTIVHQDEYTYGTFLKNVPHYRCHQDLTSLSFDNSLSYPGIEAMSRGGADLRAKTINYFKYTLYLVLPNSVIVL